ncbi:MAG: ABC transporter permease [Anaerolineales bacterium]|jgi:peptide/nickel transport system permease protein
MIRLFAIRVIETVAILIAISFLVFGLAEMIPGDIAEQIAGMEFGLAGGGIKGELNQFREEHGLNRPFVVRWADWLEKAATGDFGTSLITGREIGPDIAAAFPVSLEIAIASLLIAIATGLPVGILAAVHPASVFDRILSGTSLVFLSIPTFVSGVLFVIIGSHYFPILYASHYVRLSEDVIANLRAILLPSIVVALSMTAQIAQMTRTTMVESLQEPNIVTARSKGVSEWRISNIHALKSASGPIVTLVGLLFGSLIGGLIITEGIFNLPGLGRLVINAIYRRDFQVAVAGTWVMAMVYVGVNFIVDLLYPILDPRQRVG